MTDQVKAFCKQVRKEDNPFEYARKMVEEHHITKEELLMVVCEDCNLLNSKAVKDCVDNGLFSAQDLIDQGIDKHFVHMLGEEPEDVLPDSGYIESIGWKAKEVYFWGIPSSGKTCALGTILAAARGGNVAKSMRVEKCQGQLYQIILSQIFKREDFYCILPGRTPVDSNFAIRTVLEDMRGKDHPVTLIDMAGELFCATLWNEQGRTENLKDSHRQALQEFENMLVTKKSDNPKYHFFIIEYNEEEKKYKGFDQDVYLEHGLQYLFEKGVLANANNGLYVIVTKTDLVKRNTPQGMDPNEYLTQCLEKRYPNFLNLLNTYCKRYDMSGGLPIPFDIGEVCFQNLCQVKTERAQRIVEILMEEHQPQMEVEDWKECFNFKWF